MANGIPKFNGERVRRFRERKGWTIEGLAQSAGLESKTIGRVERGETQHPKQKTVAAIAKALGIEEVELYELESDEKVNEPHMPADHPDSIHSDDDASEILDRFKKLPGLHRLRRLKVDFINRKPEDWHRVDATEANALGLESGATIQSTTSLLVGSKSYEWETIFATRDLAESLMLEIEAGRTVTAIVTLVYGKYLDRVHTTHDNSAYDEVWGVNVERILNTGLGRS